MKFGANFEKKTAICDEFMIINIKSKSARKKELCVQGFVRL